MNVAHIPPKYHGYTGGFTKVTKCLECGCIGLYEDRHPACPCKGCGGKVTQYWEGTWDNIAAIWIAPVVKTTWFGFVTEEITPGYWKIKERNQE